jgi:DNA-binding CsgD family transcriptional regulator
MSTSLSAPQRFKATPPGANRFHLEITEELLCLAPSQFAFTCIGIENGAAFRYTKRAHGKSEPCIDRWGSTLLEAMASDMGPFGAGRRQRDIDVDLRRFAPALLRNTERRSSALLLFLESADASYGVVGLERTCDEPEFSPSETERVRDCVEFITLAARLQVAQIGLACEVAVLRTLGHTDGLLLLVDRERRSIFWADRKECSLNWKRDVEPIGEAVLQAVDQQLTTVTQPDGAPVDPSERGYIVKAAEVDGSAFSVNSCAAVCVVLDVPIPGLSHREWQVGSMLANGYAILNIAAATGLSENTVRTYVRRLYRKLHVCSRVGLTHALQNLVPAGRLTQVFDCDHGVIRRRQTWKCSESSPRRSAI